MRPTYHEEPIRGAAQRIWDAGADGVYLFNYFARPAEWKHRVLNQIGFPEALIGLNRRYEIDHFDRVMSASQIGGAFRHGLPPMQLPLTLQPAEARARLDLHVGEDIAQTAKDHTLESCTLRLRMERLGDGDALVVEVNGHDLGPDSASITTEPWSVTTHTNESLGLLRTGWRRHPFYYDKIAEPAAVVEFQVEPHMLRHRRNELRIGLAGGAHPVVLRDVELDVRFSPTGAG